MEIDEGAPSKETMKREGKVRPPGGPKPCKRCSLQHVKCVYQSGDRICQRCSQAGYECVPRVKKIRFRNTTIPKRCNGHAQSSTNTDSQNHSKHSPANMNVDVGNNTNEDDHEAEMHQSSPAAVHSTRQHQNVTVNIDQYSSGDLSTRNELFDIMYPATLHGEYPQRQILCSSTAATHSLVGQSQSNYEPNFIDSNSIPAISFAHSNTVPTEMLYTRSSDLQHISPDLHGSRSLSISYLDDIVKAPHKEMARDSEKHLEIILLRYFGERLAPWFDICDPYRHFAHVLPQRAREPGPVRSAILTIAARDLSRNPDPRSSEGLLANVTEELAMSYHNDCIRELLRLSLEPEKLHDEVLLAAVITLRTDEEMLHVDQDQQLFLRIANLFIDAQLPSFLELPRTSPQICLPISIDDVPMSPATQPDFELLSGGLRQACFWTALRQDLHAAFLKQQPVSFPLTRCETFRQLTPASDAVWAHRMVVFCADVLEYCFGSESVDANVAPAYMNRERWQELRAHKDSLCALLPLSFEPMYCCEPNLAEGEVFPSIFYLETTHVSGTTYVELATMLLETFNPDRSKLTQGLLLPTKAFVETIKKLLFRLCGIAVSNAQICPPGLVNASLGIGLFGEFFEDSMVQRALLGVLSLMTERYNYHPAAQISASLRRTWFAANSSEDTSNTVS